MYDGAAYQMFLRTVYLVYLFDTKAQIKAVVFNGWVDSHRSATGRDTKC